MADWLPAAIAGGSNLLSSGLGVMTSKSAEDRAFKRSLELQEAQNAWNYKMWQEANRYNSPSNQMQLLKDAGINPNIYDANGNLSQASELTASDAQVQQNSEIGRLASQLNPAAAIMQALQVDAQIGKLRNEIKYQQLVNRDLENQILAKEERMPDLSYQSDGAGTSDNVTKNGNLDYTVVVPTTPTTNAYQEDRQEKRVGIKKMATESALTFEELEVYLATKDFLKKIPEHQLNSLIQDVRSKVANNTILEADVDLMKKYGISPNDKDGWTSLLKLALRDPSAFSKIISVVMGQVPQVAGQIIGENLQPWKRAKAFMSGIRSTINKKTWNK